MVSIVRMLALSIAVLWVMYLAGESFTAAMVSASIDAIFQGPQSLATHWERAWKKVCGEQGVPTCLPFVTLVSLSIWSILPWTRIRRMFR